MAATLRDRRKAGIEGMTSGAGAMVATAMRVVNAIPYVVAAQPGLLSSGRSAAHDSAGRFHPAGVSRNGMVTLSHLLK